MPTGLLISVVLGFAIGMGFAIAQARRRVRQQMQDQMVLVAQERLKQAILQKATEQTASRLAEGVVADQRPSDG